MQTVAKTAFRYLLASWGMKRVFESTRSDLQVIWNGLQAEKEKKTMALSVKTNAGYINSCLF